MAGFGEMSLSCIFFYLFGVFVCLGFLSQYNLASLFPFSANHGGISAMEIEKLSVSAN